MPMYQAIISGLGEHIHLPVEAENERQAYAKAAEHAEQHLPKLLRRSIKVRPLAEGEQARDDRADLKFAPPEKRPAHRPSQGRSYRLQASITPEMGTWLESQIDRKNGIVSVSDVVFRILQEAMENH